MKKAVYDYISRETNKMVQHFRNLQLEKEHLKKKMRIVDIKLELTGRRIESLHKALERTNNMDPIEGMDIIEQP